MSDTTAFDPVYDPELGEDVDPFDGTQQEAGRKMKAIRHNAGLSIREMADLLRINDIDGLRQMERGKRKITGPIRLVLECIEDGRIDPATELDAIIGGEDGP